MKFLSSVSSKNRPLITSLLLLLLGVSGILLYEIRNNQSQVEARDRDTIRLTDIGQIKFALDQYFHKYGRYPACLYSKEKCVSLEGSSAMVKVPTDPLTGMKYAYSASKKGSVCGEYHLGASLERTASQALLTGDDAPPQQDKNLCSGSDSDFSGLSYAKGGEPCMKVAGIAQPTYSLNAETCFDVTSRN
jgi:hypothetical protein